MNSGRWKILVIAALVLAVCSSSGYSYSGGTGEPNNPYQIASPADWQQLMTTSTHWSKSFVMIADVNLAEVTTTPIGNATTKFAGAFNGNGHIIRNIVINAPGSNVGLFGYTDAAAQIHSLGIESALVTGGDTVGCLAGRSSATITDCWVSGASSGSAGFMYIGGLVGYNAGPVSSCSTDASVTGSKCIGGLVGGNYNGTIADCSTTGPTGDADSYFVGGVVGEGSGGVIKRCRAYGQVTGASDVGGLVGYAAACIVSYSCATGPVSGRWDTGGLIGDNSADSVFRCYATGSVSGTTGSNYVGGLVGINKTSLNNCYSTGTVAGSDSPVYTGGLIGRNYTGTITNCYAAGLVNGGLSGGGLVGTNTSGTVTSSFWDTDTSGRLVSDGGTGKTTSEMRTAATFRASGWDMTTATGNGMYSIWRMCADGAYYPRLGWESDAADLACPDGVAFDDLAFFARNWLMPNCMANNNFCARADIDHSGRVTFADFAALASGWIQ